MAWFCTMCLYVCMLSDVKEAPAYSKDDSDLQLRVGVQAPSGGQSWGMMMQDGGTPPP